MVDITPNAKKGDAAPLEGALGPQATAVLNLAFSVMTMNMCLGLTRSIGPALASPLLNKADLSNISLGNTAMQVKPALGMQMQAPALSMGRK